MKISKKALLQIIREEAAKSTKKYDDDSALKGDQDELPDELQKGIIDKAVEDREENEKNESIRFTRSQLRQIMIEELSLAKKEPQQLNVDSLSDVIMDLVSGELAGMADDGKVMGHGGKAAMAKQHLQQIASMSQGLHDQLSDADELPEWVQSKIAVAEDNMDAIADHIGYKLQQESRKKKD